MRIMNNNKTLFESFKENLREDAIDQSQLVDEARYLFNELCHDNGDLDDLDFEYQLSDYGWTDKEIEQVKTKVLDAWHNVKDHLYYDHENHGPNYIELSDNHTLWQINNDQVDDELYVDTVQLALRDFEEETKVELQLLGRSGRHACVELDYDNAVNYDNLKEVQSRLEQGVIDDLNSYSVEESNQVEKVKECGEAIAESDDVFKGYDKALPTVNDGREYLGYNLSDVVDAVEKFYSCKDRREAFNKVKNKEFSEEEIKKAVEYENRPVFEQDSLVRVVTPQQDERNYAITDITELNKVSDGDVLPPLDITGLLVEVDEKLSESIGENWGQINFQSTRFNSDTKDSNALFELCVGKDTYLMSMLLEENGSVLRVNNTKGQTIFKRKSNDMVGLAESYIKQFIPKEEKEVPDVIKHINAELHDALDFLNMQVDLSKQVPKEEKEAFDKYLQGQIYAFVAEVSDEIKANEPNEDDKLELPSFDNMVEEIFGKQWVKEEKEQDKVEVQGTETLKESYTEVDHKSVEDSDGFTTEYTMYKDENGKYIFIFGDRDIYTPENTYPDWEADSEQEAKEWFDSYNGFKLDEDATPVLKTKVGKFKDNNGTFYDVFRKTDGKYYDANDVPLDNDDLRQNKLAYRYVTTHDATSCPKDAFVYSEETPKGGTALYTNRPLTSAELKDYDIKPEWIQESAYDEVVAKVYTTTEIRPGVFKSALYDTYYDIEQAEDKVAELNAQGVNASYDVEFPNEDPDYDKNADETDWAAEQEADATERLERRYGKGLDESSLKERAQFYYKEFSSAGEIDYIEFETEQEACDYAEKVNKETGHETAVYRIDNDECVSLYDAINEADEPEVNEEPKNGLGTGYARFARRPKDISDLDNKSVYFTDGEASYLVCNKEKLSKEDFDRIQDDFLSPNQYCKEFDALDTENYAYNVIEFTCDDYDYTLLVDPSGYDYCRYVAKLGGNNNENNE